MKRRPKPVGRPVMGRMRDELILPMYHALSVIQSVRDTDALQAARHTLAAGLDVAYVALGNTNRDRETVERGLQALTIVCARDDAGLGVYADDDEMAQMQEAVGAWDHDLGYMRTHQLIEAITTVHEVAGIA